MAANDNTQYITSAGLVSLRDEFKKLKDATIPEIAARIDEAKQQGDLSENAEYHQAKEEMAWAQGRFFELRHIIDNAQVLDERRKSTDTISIGSSVVVKARGAEKKYTIVGARESNPAKGLISNESPLGQAFLGRRKGDTVQVNTPSGAQLYEILDMS